MQDVVFKDGGSVSWMGGVKNELFVSAALGFYSPGCCSVVVLVFKKRELRSEWRCLVI